MRTILPTIIVACLAFLSPAQAQSIGGADKLDTSFCDTKAIRQTVIYVDDMMMVEGVSDWSTKIKEKLDGSLVPSERVTVVRLSPATGQSSEVWSGCWPDYSPADAAKKEANRSYLDLLTTPDPIKVLTRQKELFFETLRSAEAKIYADAKRPADSVNFTSQTAPAKQIIRALASNDARYANATVPIRVILYSDMAENSNLGSVFTTAVGPEGLGKKLGSYLINSDFYVFGAGLTVIGNEGYMEAARRFWTSALRSMDSVIAGFDTDLTIPNIKPVTAARYRVTVEGENAHQFDGVVELLVDRDGRLVDSRITLIKTSVSGLIGTWSCAGATCKLDATTASPVMFKNSGHENLVLSGKPEAMQGSIGVSGTIYKMEAKSWVN